ncbi:hypothetical protein C8J57DRAFT_1717207, partial [Mycena rebaudengoi]
MHLASSSWHGAFYTHPPAAPVRPRGSHRLRARPAADDALAYVTYAAAPPRAYRLEAQLKRAHFTGTILVLVDSLWVCEGCGVGARGVGGEGGGERELLGASPRLIIRCMALSAVYTPPATAGNAGVAHLIYLPPACADSAGARVRAPTSRRVRRTSSCTALLFRQFSVHLSSSLPSFSSHFHLSQLQSNQQPLMESTFTGMRIHSSEFLRPSVHAFYKYCRGPQSFRVG